MRTNTPVAHKERKKRMKKEGIVEAVADILGRRGKRRREMRRRRKRKEGRKVKEGRK